MAAPSASRPSPALLIGAAAAAVVSMAALGIGTTLVCAAVAGAALLLVRHRRAAATTASRTTAPLAATTLPNSSTVPPAQGASHPAVEVPEATALVEQLRQDCVDRGFFVDHRVSVQKATRRNPLVATLTAASRTNKNFVITVTATGTPYGTHVEAGWADRGMGVASSLAARSGGSTFRNGVSAGREAVLKRQVPAMETEFAAFRREVLSRYAS